MKGALYEDDLRNPAESGEGGSMQHFKKAHSAIVSTGSVGQAYVFWGGVMTAAYTGLVKWLEPFSADGYGWPEAIALGFLAACLTAVAVGLAMLGYRALRPATKPSEPPAVGQIDIVREASPLAAEPKSKWPERNADGSPGVINFVSPAYSRSERDALLEKLHRFTEIAGQQIVPAAKGLAEARSQWRNRAESALRARTAHERKAAFEPVEAILADACARWEGVKVALQHPNEAASAFAPHTQEMRYAIGTDGEIGKLISEAARLQGRFVLATQVTLALAPLLDGDITHYVLQNGVMDLSADGHAGADDLLRRAVQYAAKVDGRVRQLKEYLSG